MKLNSFQAIVAVKTQPSTVTALSYTTNTTYDIDDFNCADFALTLFNINRTGNNVIYVPNTVRGIVDYGTTPNGIYSELKAMKDGNHAEYNNIFIGVANSPTVRENVIRSLIMARKVFYRVLTVIILSNIVPIDRVVSNGSYFRYSNLDGSVTFSEFKSRDFDMMKRRFISYKETIKSSDTTMYRLFKKNPLAFWKWANTFLASAIDCHSKNGRKSLS